MAFKKSYGFRRSTAGLKRCLECKEILTTEEYDNGYDYHLKCYIKLKKEGKI